MMRKVKSSRKEQKKRSCVDDIDVDADVDIDANTDMYRWMVLKDENTYA